MTHEIKTPLSTIGISAQVLSNPNIIKHPERLSNYASIVLQQNKRLEKQIEKVLQLAQMDKKNYRLQKTPVDIEALIRELIDGFEPLIKDKEGRIRFENKSDQSITVLADRVHLANVLHNLVDNAIKYSTKKPRITIRLYTTYKHVHISVSDKGLGMEKKHLSRIFQKFYRIPTGNIHDIKGFGIGLNYGKTVIRKHHWKITVESIPNNGSTFEIIIPQKK